MLPSVVARYLFHTAQAHFDLGEIDAAAHTALYAVDGLHGMPSAHTCRLRHLFQIHGTLAGGRAFLEQTD
ncbi:hypothetical protein [Streptomyces sp. NPDC001135]